MSPFFTFGLIFTIAVAVVGITIGIVQSCRGASYEEIRRDECRYSEAVEKCLIARGYELLSGSYLRYDENSLDGHMGLFSYGKRFGEDYYLKISTDGRCAVHPMSDVCWTIYFNDGGGREWGHAPDISFYPDPDIGISLLEEHARLAFEARTNKLEGLYII